MALEIPDPCLVVLVGAAGSGKSTFAARHFAPDEVLSSDAFRELIAGDPADQTATHAAFSALHKALARRLFEGRLTVVDATSVQRGARAALLRRSAAAGVPAVAVVLALPPDVVQARNRERPPGAIVPAEAVDRQLAALATALRPDGMDAEDFARIHVLTTPADVDAAVVLRVPGQRGPA
ncbi:MAG TPA: AAA family ATPase [Candidatus Limnocylindrales bacterium]